MAKNVSIQFYKIQLTFFFPLMMLMWKSCSSIHARTSGNTEPLIGGRTDLPLNLAAASEFFAPKQSHEITISLAFYWLGVPNRFCNFLLFSNIHLLLHARSKLPFKEGFCQFTITLLLCYSPCKEKQFHIVFISHLKQNQSDHYQPDWQGKRGKPRVCTIFLFLNAV